MSLPVLYLGDFQLLAMQLQHAKGYSDILSDPETWHFLTESGPVDEQAARAKIIRNQEVSAEGKSLYWSILNAADTFVGYIAIHNYQNEKVSISYGIHPAHRRKGIASHILTGLLKWKGLKNKKAEMATHVENVASYQLLSGMDLNYEGVVETPFGKRHVFSKVV